MKPKIFGLILLILVVAGSFVYFYFFSDGESIQGFTTKRVEIQGFIGSEKSNFLENPRVKTILRNKFGLIVDYSKAGSIEMVNMPVDSEVDFLWPSSQVALEIYKLSNPGSVKSEIVFNSPIVLYSWDMVADAMESEGYIEKRDNSYYIIKFKSFLELILEGKKWSDIGLDQLYGNISIISTDPTKSNSGNMFSGLLGNILTNDIVDSSSIDSVLPQIRSFFSKLGFMEHSTGVLFDQYLEKGVGSYPLIVGYENQIVEFSLQNPEIWPLAKDKMRILYPEPTVWSSHPIIALSADGEKLLEALQSEELQNLAWEEHGFRTGLLGVQNDPSILKIEGIPEDVTKVIPMPTPQVMTRIIEELKNL
jgi:hypothetical protein